VWEGKVKYNSTGDSFPKLGFGKEVGKNHFGKGMVKYNSTVRRELSHTGVWERVGKTPVLEGKLKYNST
jgi:hypothetical protein